MSHHKHAHQHNPGSPRDDRSRAELRGKGRAPDDAPKPRDEELGLRGHTTPEQAKREEGARYRPPPQPEDNDV